MAVIAQALSLIIPVEVLETRFPGGVEAYRSAVPNRSWCTDGRLTRVGFVSPRSLRAWIESLQRKGLVFCIDDEAVDMVVVDQREGPTRVCPWIRLVRGAEGVICVLSPDESEDSFRLCVPEGWSPVTALDVHRIGPDEGSDDFELVRCDGGALTYRERLTGEWIHVSEPLSAPGSANARLDDIASRAHEIFEVRDAQGRRGRSTLEGADELRALDAECRRLRHAMGVELPRCDYARAICLRSLGEDKAALTIFETVSTVWPQDARLQAEIANCAGRIGAYARAEVAARRGTTLDPLCAVSWANLACALHYLGRRAEALEAVRHAERLNPDGDSVRWLVAATNADC